MRIPGDGRGILHQGTRAILREVERTRTPIFFAFVVRKRHVRDRDAAQSARDDLAVAGGVADAQADAVVAQSKTDAGQKTRCFFCGIANQ